MDILARAFIQAKKEVPDDHTAAEFQKSMIENMVRWIELRVYPRNEWPRSFGPYPKEIAQQVKR